MATQLSPLPAGRLTEALAPFLLSHPLAQVACLSLLAAAAQGALEVRCLARPIDTDPVSSPPNTPTRPGVERHLGALAHPDVHPGEPRHQARRPRGPPGHAPAPPREREQRRRRRRRAPPHAAQSLRRVTSQRPRLPGAGGGETGSVQGAGQGGPHAGAGNGGGCVA